MRNDFTDNLGDQITTEFKESNLSVNDFVDSKVASGAFDFRHGEEQAGFHTIEHGIIISYYFVANRNRWYAKF